MAFSPKIVRLCLYPIKSLDGIEVPSCKLFPKGGGLWGDRMWAIFDEKGEAVTGKTEPRIFKLRAQFDGTLSRVKFDYEGKGREFSLLDQTPGALNQYLSEVLEQKVFLRKDMDSGFPDYTSNPGPSIVSTASLEAVCVWFPGMDLTQARRRFRASVEIDGVPAFWEDCLFLNKDEPRPFTLGEFAMQGMGPIMRCPVPTRDPDTCEIQLGFQRQFILNRRSTFQGREGIETERLEEAYYLAVKTQASDSKGKFLQVGDLLRLL